MRNGRLLAESPPDKLIESLNMQVRVHKIQTIPHNLSLSPYGTAINYMESKVGRNSDGKYSSRWRYRGNHVDYYWIPTVEIPTDEILLATYRIRFLVTKSNVNFGNSGFSSSQSGEFFYQSPSRSENKWMKYKIVFTWSFIMNRHWRRCSCICVLAMKPTMRMTMSVASKRPLEQEWDWWVNSRVSKAHGIKKFSIGKLINLRKWEFLFYFFSIVWIENHSVRILFSQLILNTQ